MKLEKLLAIINNRKLQMPRGSYVASLFQLGEDRIIQKFGEEAVEVVIASKNQGKKRLVSEIADLLFHLLILQSLKNIDLSDIEKELEKRNK